MKRATKKPESRSGCVFELFWHFSWAVIIVAAIVDADGLVRTNPILADIFPTPVLEGALFNALAWPYVLLLSLVLVLSRTMVFDLFV